MLSCPFFKIAAQFCFIIQLSHFSSDIGLISTIFYIQFLLWVSEKDGWETHFILVVRNTTLQKIFVCNIGELCDVDINECVDEPCVYGNCTNYEGGYGCFCYSGYTGKLL